MDQDQDREERELLNGLVDGTLNLDSLRNDSPGDIIQHDDDAIDYEDISDDDLPDEEPATQPSRGAIDEGTSHETRDEIDDLFDDPDHDHHPSPPTSGTEEFQDASSPAEHGDQKRLKSGPFGITEEMRRMNFNNQDPDIPDAADNVQDTLAAAFPGWLPGKVLDFNTLLPTKPARITEKKPAKPPKPLLPTKLNLELDNGQQNIFRMPGNATLSATQRAQFYEAENLVPLVPNQPIEEALDHEDSYDDDTPVAGYSLQEWDIICSDWTANEPVPALTNDSKSEDEDGDSDTFEFDDEQEQPPAKKRKTRELGLPELPKYVAPNFDNYETATARNGNRVLLDMNDPFLLVDEEDHPPKRLKTQAKSTANGNRVRSMRSRLNYSNDDEYLALNQNHSNKIRATLGNFSVEHSAPALKLMWPFYKAKPQYQQAWFEDFHRPKLNPRYVMHLSAKWERPRKRKRKDTKGKKVQEIFATTRDLSLNDNSTAVLFEYCEETPTTMSKFGMGNRVINYYRRKPGDDSESKQQKADLGETHVLQPEDRSPFSIFGTVDPGETVPTLHNQMFRAPIFKHEPREGDFLLGRTTMGLDKRSDSCTWFLRKIDHLYTVGQTFPSVEVPGPRARKVTTMTSNRMKMVAYRMMHRRNTRTVGLSEITQHIAGSTDSQNRQKLKEFLQYEKEKKQWGLREGEELMSSAKIRNMIKPEDVCLIDAMHVGLGTLDYAEYKKQAKPPRDKEKDDEDDNEPIAQDDSSKTLMMAPWYTTKAFIDASAGKAMLQLHGEGDPTGHGLGFSFVRTSMKGGYIESLQGPNATSQELMERERKANGGHSYNVRRQDELYNAAIKQIWNRQKETLSDDKQHEDDDVVQTHDEDNRFGNDDDAAHDHGTVAAPTPLGFDDSVSQVSRSTSMTNRKRQGEVLVIRRKVRNEFGEIVPQVVQITDPDIAALYLTRRKEHLAEKTDLLAIAPTHDEELNKLLQEKIDDELERLVKNQARRVVREKQKAGKDGKGTARKCANCGQIGHIKTNKKLCPMFNGGATPASPAPPPPPPPVPTPSSPAGLVSSGAGEQN